MIRTATVFGGSLDGLDIEAVGTHLMHDFRAWPGGAITGPHERYDFVFVTPDRLIAAFAGDPS